MKATAPDPRIDRLTAWLAEGKAIVARHDGVHGAHNAVYAIGTVIHSFTIPLSSIGLSHSFAIAERCITRLRVLDSTGFWPKEPTRSVSRPRGWPSSS